eukprot:539722_1
MCKKCSFINQKLMIGKIWHLLNEMNKCWLCGHYNEEKEIIEEIECITLTLTDDIDFDDSKDKINISAHPHVHEENAKLFAPNKKDKIDISADPKCQELNNAVQDEYKDDKNQFITDVIDAYYANDEERLPLEKK